MSQRVTELKWALIFIVTMLLWMVMERAVGLHDEHIDKHMMYTNLFAIPAILIYLLALRQKREKDYGGHMSYKQGVVSGLLITLIVTAVAPLTQYVIGNYITPDYFTNISAYAVSIGQMTSQEAADYFNYQNYAIQATIGAFVMGLITTLIVAFFVKRS